MKIDEMALDKALGKRKYIVDRYGDENGERLTKGYLEQLYIEEIRRQEVIRICSLSR